MDEKIVKATIEKNNKIIDDFIQNELPTLIGSKDGKISLEQWFKAQSIIQGKNFYKTSYTLLQHFRALGYDVKINCQSDKLSYHGRITQ